MSGLRHAWWVLALALLGVVSIVRAQEPGEVVVIDAPVVDQAGVTSTAERAAIGEMLGEHRQSTGVQMAVLFVRSTQGEPIEDYALRVASAWGGGQKGRDDGILLAFAVSDRRMRLEVGYGLEPAIPDGVARAARQRAARAARRRLRRGGRDLRRPGDRTHAAREARPARHALRAPFGGHTVFAYLAAMVLGLIGGTLLCQARLRKAARRATSNSKLRSAGGAKVKTYFAPAALLASGALTWQGGYSWAYMLVCAAGIVLGLVAEWLRKVAAPVVLLFYICLGAIYFVGAAIQPEPGVPPSQVVVLLGYHIVWTVIGLGLLSVGGLLFFAGASGGESSSTYGSSSWSSGSSFSSGGWSGGGARSAAAGPARAGDAPLGPQYALGMRVLVWALTLLLGCGGAATPPAPSTPAAAVPSPARPNDPFAVTGNLERETLPASPPAYPMQPRALPRVPQGLPAPPALCKDFSAPSGNPATCEAATALGSLEAALALTEAEKRDAALAALEGCAALPAGVVRALRAELAPVACGDIVVESYLREPPAALSGPVYDALFGLALAARLARAATEPPPLKPPHTKETVQAYIQGPMGAWVREHAEAIQRIAELGAKLRGYGKAVVAVEAGMADMRFIVAAREVPVPEEIARFEEAVETYQQNLELSLDARKQRGRDAALVGLGQLAQLGVIRDPRVVRARELLSQMYGGAPIDALDALRLPPLAPAHPTSAEERLAARLPTFYAGVLLDASQAPAQLRALIEKGVPLPQRIALAATELGPEQRALYARARLEMAQNYWRRVDVDEMVGLLASWSGARGPEVALLLATGLALRGGPASAAEMMIKAPLSELRLGDVKALDALAAAGGPLAGMAAFNAALVHELSAPADAGAAYWEGIAARYRKAAELSADVRDRDDAERRARDALATAEAIRTRAP